VTWSAAPIRRGKAVTFTLDQDAEPLLRAMAGHRRTFGQLISELIRREARERAQRPQLLERLAAEVDTGIVQEIERAID
jgi:hypothetical protein